MTNQAQVTDTMVQITLPDGATRDYAAGITGMEIAESISKSLAKAVIAIEIDGELSDLSLPIDQDVSISLLKRTDEQALETLQLVQPTDLLVSRVSHGGRGR